MSNAPLASTRAFTTNNACVYHMHKENFKIKPIDFYANLKVTFKRKNRLIK